MSTATKIRRALISVYDKTGLVDFARALHDEFGIELISTGGTAKALKDAGIPVTLVEDVTGFPEMMDGRVKTLHPKIHAAILADRDNPEHMRQLKEQGIEPIDMVVVNLYPFEKTIAKPDCTFEEAIEMIDIGGPCLLRAAAKNHKHVWPLPAIALGARALDEMRKGDPESSLYRRQMYAGVVYMLTFQYDSAISIYLNEQRMLRTGIPPEPPLPQSTWREFHKLGEFRYGENPHQRGAAYRIGAKPVAFHPYDLSSQEQLSYNNVVDGAAAADLCRELTRSEAFQSCCCFIKHTNACGLAVGANPVEVYRRAYLGDPNAAMGGILAVNFNVNVSFAETVMETFQRFGKPLKEAGKPHAPGGFFVEVWVAPFFDAEAVKLIRGESAPTGDFPSPPQKDWGRRVRLLAVGDMSAAPDARNVDFRLIGGGMLMQDRDLVGLNEEQWKVVTQRQPTETEMDDLRLAWLICKHTKSNAITICKDGALLGNGAGQMSRVMSCRIATWLAKENGHADALKGAVAASDAFFPFRDGPDILIDAGVAALIQPGGSKRDDDTIAACNERGVAMIFTGTRHFKH